MPNYLLRCTVCQSEVRLRQGMTEALPRVCGACGRAALEAVLHAVMVMDGTPRTLGGQADRNYAQSGCYERAERQAAIAAARTRARAESQDLPPGMESARPEKPTYPWYRPDSGPDMALTRLSPDQRKNFIEKGTV